MDSIDKSSVTSFESLGLTKPKESLKTPKLGQEDFMKLMMAQMHNQDPFKPMEDGEFLTQMAQFSAVSGLKDIKNSFVSLSESLKSNQALQASSMVGRNVLVPGSVVELKENAGLRGAVEIKESTANLKISVFDKSGELVHTIEKGEQTQGMVKFSWDGKVKVKADGDKAETVQSAKAGEYTLRAEIELEGESQAVDTLVVDAVESVSLGKDGQGITLNLARAGSTGLSTVKEIM